MASFVYFLTLAAVAAVALVLLMGLWNLVKGGSPSTSQSLMRMRIALQFIAIIILMGALWFSQG